MELWKGKIFHSTTKYFPRIKRTRCWTYVWQKRLTKSWWMSNRIRQRTRSILLVSHRSNRIKSCNDHSEAFCSHFLNPGKPWAFIWCESLLSYSIHRSRSPDEKSIRGEKVLLNQTLANNNYRSRIEDWKQCRLVLQKWTLVYLRNVDRRNKLRRRVEGEEPFSWTYINSIDLLWYWTVLLPQNHTDAIDHGQSRPWK